MSVQITVSNNNDTNPKRTRKIHCPVCNMSGTATVQYTTGYIIVAHAGSQCYMRNDAEKRMVMDVLAHWPGFKSKALYRLVKYGTLANVKKYIPSDIPKIEEDANQIQTAKELRNIFQYNDGEKVELVKNGKIILTKVHITYGQHSNKTQKKCPKCGQLGREYKNFSPVSKKGYYDVYYQHKLGNARFRDINTGETVKRRQLRKICKVGKGYTMEMMLSAMNKEEKP